MLSWADKDPNEQLDYTVDWSATLDTGDTISASTWVNFPGGLTKISSSNTTTHTVLWVSGGTAGVTYTITNRITTVGGRVFDQSVKLKVWGK